MRAFATNGAVIGNHRAIVQAEALEHVTVGLVHAVIGLLQGSLVKMEGVGVLHDKFARPHQAEARADFITEFGLDLIQVQR